MESLPTEPERECTIGGFSPRVGYPAFDPDTMQYIFVPLDETLQDQAPIPEPDDVDRQILKDIRATLRGL